MAIIYTTVSFQRFFFFIPELVQTGTQLVASMIFILSCRRSRRTVHGRIDYPSFCLIAESKSICSNELHLRYLFSGRKEYDKVVDLTLSSTLIWSSTRSSISSQRLVNKNKFIVPYTHSGLDIFPIFKYIQCVQYSTSLPPTLSLSLSCSYTQLRIQKNKTRSLFSSFFLLFFFLLLFLLFFFFWELLLDPFLFGGGARIPLIQ